MEDGRGVSGWETGISGEVRRSLGCIGSGSAAAARGGDIGWDEPVDGAGDSSHRLPLDESDPHCSVDILRPSPRWGKKRTDHSVSP